MDNTKEGELKIMHRKYNIHLLTAYMAVILLLHVIPLSSDIVELDKIKVIDIRLDYLLHVLIFIPWALILWLAFDICFRTNAVKAFLWLLAGMAFAAGAEYLQNFLPYRAFNINDVMGNVIGVVLGGVVFFWKPPNKFFN